MIDYIEFLIDYSDFYYNQIYKLYYIFDRKKF